MTERSRIGNVPPELTSFVGRTADLARVGRILERDRLVTLTGVGGVGKTRLALRLAAQRRDLPDGVRVVELAAVLDPTLVPETVAAALGVQDRTSRELPDVLAAYLAERTLLLVMDNCEHVAGAVAFLLTDLLRAAPRLRLLATSREPLEVPGEVLYRVMPLSVPHLEEIDEVVAGQAATHQDSAVTLFVDRAAAALPGFCLTPDNAGDVAEICRRLDGIPLAVELAAAKLRALSPRQVSERLADRFRLLAGQDRTALPQHQTLRAAVDWSYNLCTKPERLVWQRVSVFAGSFDLDAAEHVCRGGGLADGELLESIDTLVDKSVLTCERRPDGNRYHLLDTLRQYGLDQVNGGDAAFTGLEGGEDELRRRHLDWYVERAERFDVDWFGPRQREWRARMLAESPNFRAALAFAVRNPQQVRQGMRLVTALYSFWQVVAVREGRLWLERLLAADPTPGLERARALSALALLCRDVGLSERGVGAAREAVSLLEVFPDPARLTRTLGTLGFLLLQTGDAATAPTLDQALAHARDLHDPAETAYTTLSVGCCVALLGDRARGEALLAESMDICRAAGDTWWLGRVLVGAALVALLHDDLTSAEGHAAQALRAGREVEDDHSCVTALHLIGLGEAGRDSRRGARLFGATGRYWHDVGGSPFDAEAWQELFRARAALARQALGDTDYDAECARGARLSVEQATAFALRENIDRPVCPTGDADGDLGPATVGRLTRREREVAGLVAEGLGNKQIAQRLVLSERTVGGHVQSILTKLSFRSRTQIVTWVARQDRPDGDTPGPLPSC